MPKVKLAVDARDYFRVRVATADLSSKNKAGSSLKIATFSEDSTYRCGQEDFTPGMNWSGGGRAGGGRMRTLRKR